MSDTLDVPEVREHPKSFPYEDFDFGGVLDSRSMFDIINLDVTQEYFETVISSEDAPQSWKARSKSRGQVRRHLPSAHHYLRRLSGPALYRAVFEFIGLLFPFEHSMIKILDYLSQIQPMQRPESTDLYRKVVGILEEVQIRGAEVNWASTANLTPGDLDLEVLLALAIYGTTDDGYGALPEKIVSLLHRTGLAWMFFLPELQIIPRCWAKWARTLWFTDVPSDKEYDELEEAEEANSWQENATPDTSHGQASPNLDDGVNHQGFPSEHNGNVSEQNDHGPLDSDIPNSNAEDENDPLHSRNWPLCQSPDIITGNEMAVGNEKGQELSRSEVNDLVMNLYRLGRDLAEQSRPEPVDFNEYCAGGASAQNIRGALEALSRYINDRTQRLYDEARVQAIVGDEMHKVICDVVQQETWFDFERHQGLHSRHRHAVQQAFVEISRLKEEVGQEASTWRWTWMQTSTMLGQVARFQAEVEISLNQIVTIREQAIAFEKKFKKLKRRVGNLEDTGKTNTDEIDTLKRKVEVEQLERDALRLEIGRLRTVISDRDKMLESLEAKMTAQVQTLQTQHQQQFRALQEAQRQIMNHINIAIPPTTAEEVDSDVSSTSKVLKGGNDGVVLDPGCLSPTRQGKRNRNEDSASSTPSKRYRRSV